MDQTLGFQMIQAQTQRLIMNQEMRQAISILQFSSSELASYVDAQLESNPVFDIDRSVRRNKKNASLPNPVETMSSKSVSLEDVLLEQLSFHKLSAERHKIGIYLIGLLDDDGYLREDLQQIASELACTSDDVEHVLKLIQSFEPVGIAARDLAECLWIQLRTKGEATPLAEKLLFSHLHDLAEGNFDMLAQQYSVAMEAIEEVMASIALLHPRPAVNYHSDKVNYIVPDIYVELVEGQLHFVLNEQVYPQLQIDKSYEPYIKRRSLDAQSMQYIKEHLRNAQWLIRSIEQRKETIMKVAQCIFTYQKDFLYDGFEALRPLTQSEVAQTLGVHESTVSRATNQKYVQTSKGVFELKRFFIHGIRTATGSRQTPYPIKRRIKEMIAAENTTSPLSDQQITNQLNLEGIHISRRTVMKYREELNIPASSKRRSRT